MLIASIEFIRDERLRAEYPYESLETRLPARPPAVAAISTASAARLAALEDNAYLSAHNTARTWGLRSLHEETVQRFVNSPGFGIARLITPPSGKTLVADARTPLSLPDAPKSMIRSTGDLKEQPSNSPTIYEEMHIAGLVDFVYPRGWGHIKDRRHVAGFRSHGFSKAPESSSPLSVVSIDLVGLSRDEPAVYISKYLPLMSELQKAPTRSPDVFESAGLSALRSGEDLFAKQTENGLRLLGAIRTTKQCVDCHGSQRGDLLGAFSYVFR